MSLVLEEGLSDQVSRVESGILSPHLEMAQVRVVRALKEQIDRLGFVPSPYCELEVIQVWLA